MCTCTYNEGIVKTLMHRWDLLSQGTSFCSECLLLSAQQRPNTTLLVRVAEWTAILTCYNNRVGSVKLATDRNNLMTCTRTCYSNCAGFKT